MAGHLPAALINHDYQHDRRIGEVHAADLGRALPSDPESDRLGRADGYLAPIPCT